MKSITIFLMIFILYLPVLSQNCEDCRDNDYPFKGCCDPPRMVCIRCTNDPLSSTDDFRAFKKCNLNTALIDYDDSDFPFGDGIQWEPSGDIVILKSDTHSDISNALIEWIIVCVPEPGLNNIDCDNCRLEIKWTREAAEMQGYPSALAIDHQPLAPVVGGGPCKPDCNKSYIAINATNGFMNCDPDIGEFPIDGNFFYTNEDCGNKNDWFHFYSTVAHEIGHWLGLGDVNSSCKPSGVDETDMTMYWELLPEEEKTTLTYHDKCMFKLLYYCDPINDVNEQNNTYIRDLKVIPNPSNQEIIAKFMLKKTSNVDIYIFDNIGRLSKAALNNDIINAGENKIRISISDLAPGVYHLVLQNNNYKYSKKFIIKD